jgi:hypothetical protein
MGPGLSSSTKLVLLAFVFLAIGAQMGLVRSSVVLAAGTDPIVAFNTRSMKFHHPDCDAAKACTVNCIFVSRSEALRRGGTPCKHCGGGMRLSPARPTLQAIVPDRASLDTPSPRPAAQHV